MANPVSSIEFNRSAEELNLMHHPPTIPDSVLDWDTSERRSVADIDTLTAGGVAEILASLDTSPRLLLFALVVYTTGVDPNRLESAIVDSSNPTDEMPHLDGPRLRVRLARTPTSRLYKPERSAKLIEQMEAVGLADCMTDWVICYDMSLIQSLVEDANRKGARPFAGLSKAFDALFEEHFAMAWGETPTIDMLRATGEWRIEQRVISPKTIEIFGGRLPYFHEEFFCQEGIPLDWLAGVHQDVERHLCKAIGKHGYVEVGTKDGDRLALEDIVRSLSLGMEVARYA